VQKNTPSAPSPSSTAAAAVSAAPRRRRHRRSFLIVVAALGSLWVKKGDGGLGLGW